jgi:hypothetical protein
MSLYAGEIESGGFAIGGLLTEPHNGPDYWYPGVGPMLVLQG